MKIDIISIFPEMFAPVFGIGMARLAQERGLVRLAAHDLRDYTFDKHRQVDDQPYGGGPGMVMKPEPFYEAVGSLCGGNPFVLSGGVRTILLSPRGEKLEQRLVRNLAGAEHLIILCGRYEGTDARVGGFVSDEISIGDFILSGGEIAAMVLVDAVVRLIGGVLGAAESLIEESFTAKMLEYPQFTRPVEWLGQVVPGILRSGDHRSVMLWRREQAARITRARRPDLSS